jgi:hypothetical protein
MFRQLLPNDGSRLAALALMQCVLKMRVLIPHVWMQKAVLLKAAQERLAVQPGLGSHLVKT